MTYGFIKKRSRKNRADAFFMKISEAAGKIKKV